MIVQPPADGTDSNRKVREKKYTVTGKNTFEQFKLEYSNPWRGYGTSVNHFPTLERAEEFITALVEAQIRNRRNGKPDPDEGYRLSKVTTEILRQMPEFPGFQGA